MNKNSTISENQVININKLDSEFVKQAIKCSGIIDIANPDILSKIAHAFFRVALLLLQTDECNETEKQNILLCLQGYYNFYEGTKEKKANEIIELITSSHIIDNVINLETLTETATNAYIVSELLRKDELGDEKEKDFIAFKYKAVFDFVKMLIYQRSDI